MNNLVFVRVYEMHKIHWNVEIQMNRLIQARRLDLVLINKQNKKEKKGIKRTCRLDNRSPRP